MGSPVTNFSRMYILSTEAKVYKYDVSLPLPRMYELVEDTRARLLGAVATFGDRSRPVLRCQSPFLLQFVMVENLGRIEK